MSQRVNSLTVTSSTGFHIGSTNVLTFDASGLTSNQTLSIPNTTDTLVGQNTTDSLSNKTLINPVILNGGQTITIPSSSDTLVGRSTTDTLTNKNLSGTSNIVQASSVGQGSNAVSVSGGASAGYVLRATSSSAATWQPSAQTYSANITTTNNTATTILSIPTVDNSTYIISALIAARRTDSGTESGSFQLLASYLRQNGAGTLAQIQSDDLSSFLITGTWNVVSSADTSGGNIIIQVSGDAGKTIDWNVYVTLTSVS